MSIFNTGHATQKLNSLLFWKFHWVWRDVEETLQIIKKMTDLCKSFYTLANVNSV